MVSKGVIATGVFTVFVLVSVVKIYSSTISSSESTDQLQPYNNHNSKDSDNLYSVTTEIIKQRNELSKQLNLKQQKIGQMECEKEGSKREATSGSGGWCQSSSKEDSGHHMTDKPLAAALADFFKGKRVASFGDGPGRYKQLILDSKKVSGYDAYDGAPYCDTTSDGRVKFLDLTLPQYGLPLYDWVMSLEVAEHIPVAYEEIYVSNVVRHAKEGIILSWAVPGQGGYSHVNLRTFAYVKDLMDKNGFSHDPAESEKLRSVSTLPWLQKNVNVYRRRDLSKMSVQEVFYV